ncbi:phage antirepressor KilAC domain-containing protein [Priestia megaterium]|uniref:phage antirepressor KilAC domain-containing protein n=1 Tax=Priestia megaterium TaxID=1404 RepID=UPI00211C6E74|nr:phage antirepressor KilAC domain-containing protein [Priestia megaterium]
MTELKMIHNETLLGKEFKVYGDVDVPLFLAKDIADWIDYNKTPQGYYDVSAMLRVVDNEEKVKIRTTINNPSGSEMWFLTEDGVYEVLMQSRKPKAKAFKKLVKTILKKIRMTGGAVIEGREEEFVNKHFPSFSEEVKHAMAMDLYKKNRELSEQIKEAQPKLETYEDFIDSKDNKKIGQIAQALGLGQNKLFAILRDKGVLKSSFANKNEPYQKYIDQGYFFPRVRPVGKKGSTKNVIVTTVTPKGAEWISKKLREWEVI